MAYEKYTWKKGDPITAERLNNIEEGIEQGGNNGTSSGGSSSLPTPGAAGNVLTSTGEAWESAAPMDNVLVCDFTMGDTITCNKSVSEIIAAFNNGKVIIGTMRANEAVLQFYAANDGHPSFMSVSYVGGDAYVGIIVGSVEDEEDSWGFLEARVDGLPAASGSDNGKILGVDGGAYALVDAKTPFIVAGTVDGTFGAMTVTITDSLADIYAAAEAGRYVALEFSLGGGMFRLPLYGRLIEDETISLSFSKTIFIGDPAIYTVEFEGTQTASVNTIILVEGDL